jgi:hypothetical protein
MQHFSGVAHAAYHDLLRSLRDEEFSDIQGTPHKERRGNREYWYDMFRLGTRVVKRYLGEDSEETRDRIARHSQLAAEKAQRDKNRNRLIRLLRSEGVPLTDPATGSILSALARIGTFRLGGTLVGTHAFRLYEGELNRHFSQTETLQTGDIDIAQFERLSLALGDQVKESMAKTFNDLEFSPVPSLKKGSVWRWRQTKSDTLVEFLTPSFRPEEDIRPLPALGVSAQSLHFLNYLIAEPIKAAVLYRSGLLVQIPRPERYAIHKLIVANRRQAGPDAMKSRKDRLQAELIIRTMAEDRPGDLQDAYEDALSHGPRWQEHIAASLKLMPAVQSILHNL